MRSEVGQVPAEPGHSEFCPWPGQRCERAARRGERTEGCLPRGPSTPRQLSAFPLPLSARGRDGAGDPSPELLAALPLFEGERGRLLSYSLVPADAILKYFFPPLTGTFFLEL